MALEPALLDDYTWRALLSNGCEQPNYRFVAAVKARLAPALEPASA